MTCNRLYAAISVFFIGFFTFLSAQASTVPLNKWPALHLQNSTASVVELARVRSGAQMARVLRPGQIITKEFNAQRLNLEVDANGRIVAVRCG